VCGFEPFAERSVISRRVVAELAGWSAVCGILVAGILAPAVLGFGATLDRVADAQAEDSTGMLSGRLPSATTVLDSTGTPIAYLYRQNRTVLTSRQISTAMKAAVVAIEDRRFFEHRGVDWLGVLRASAANGASGEVRQGASTLTQQYVKDYELYVAARTDTERLRATEPTIARKLRDVLAALQLEKHLDKDQILTGYLNIVFLGNNTYGVAEGARTYFDTTADRLTVPQAALLAGLVNSTAAYDPVSHPAAALGRRNLVITAMRDQGMITPAAAAAASASPLGIVDPLHIRPNGCLGAGDDGYFCQYVVGYLASLGLDADAVDTGGYTIRTTLDPRAEAQAKAAVNAVVPARQPHVADAISVVTPGADKHRVIAMAANRTFGLRAGELETSYGLPYEPVNLGAGSIYKIFTSAVALEKGLGIDSVLEVPPSGYVSPLYRDGAGHARAVRNDGDYPDHLTLQEALAKSPNTAFVKLEEFTGISPVVDMAVKLGLRSLATTPFVDPATGRRTDHSIAEVTKAQQHASFTLGDTPTSILELANVGATLDSAGRWCPPSPIESITGPSGAPVALAEPACAQVLDPGLANTLLTGLSHDAVDGTAAASARASGWTRPIAAKTGTTEQYKSAGFLGIVPQLAGAVIVFDDSARPRPLCDPGATSAPVACADGDIYGGKAPARTWFQMMNGYLADQPVWPLPPTDPRYTEGGRPASVPSEIGRNAGDAEADLRALGWRTGIAQVANRAPAGTVVGESPLGPSLPGDVVTLQVSSGQVPPPPPPP
jgi:membrane peptidoglycan carboxypeptidase